LLLDSGRPKAPWLHDSYHCILYLQAATTISIDLPQVSIHTVNTSIFTFRGKSSLRVKLKSARGAWLGFGNMDGKQPEKGCFNCTKRRIICDRTGPNCQKCQKKGLQCPGYGTRYRFKAEISSKPAKPATLGLPKSAVKIPSSLKWVECQPQHEKGSFASADDDVQEEGVEGILSHPLEVPTEQNKMVHSQRSFDLVISTGVARPLNTLDAQTRFLFSHCRLSLSM
jgi:hypothetical protein